MHPAIPLFAVAVPVILLMAIWAGVMAFRLLFPEDTMPFDPVARRKRATQRGSSVPVRLRDIMEDERARHAVSAGRGQGGAPADNPLFEDLWLRRN